MQRQKVSASSAPSYPTRSRYQGHSKVLACAGLMLLLIGAPGCPGDVAVPIDGDIAVPHETFFVSLPAEGSRTLYFGEGVGWVDFHVELVVDNVDLNVFLRENAAVLLERTAAILAEEPIYSFDDIERIHELEDRVRQMIADEWTGSEEAPVWNFVECALIVDELFLEEIIDGDMP